MIAGTKDFQSTGLRRSIIAYLESEPEGRGPDGLPVPVSVRRITSFVYTGSDSRSASAYRLRHAHTAIQALAGRNHIEVDPMPGPFGGFLWRRPVSIREAQAAAEFHAARVRELLDELVNLPRESKHRPRPPALVTKVMDAHIVATYWAARTETPGVDGWFRGRRVLTRRTMPS